jgi:hypothetical protein
MQDYNMTFKTKSLKMHLRTCTLIDGCCNAFENLYLY